MKISPKKTQDLSISQNRSYYFVVYSNSSYDGDIMAAITPRDYFNRRGCLSDAYDPIPGIKDWCRCMDSTFEYKDRKASMKEQHESLLAQGFVFSEKMALFLYKLGNDVYLQK